MGIIVPHVNTAEEARRLVSAMRYPHQKIERPGTCGFWQAPPDDIRRRITRERTGSRAIDD